ncbi:MAG TPA: tetratricopeptide repeat-containing diguanylate cyclase [Roseateles sp.]|nr:tetratricopeptide repeat-containing diguanylate cyclase [Roseateles sp.]
MAPPMSARALLGALACGMLLLLLLACQPAGVPKQAPRNDALWQALERIERQGRARPREQEEALLTLQGQSAPGSMERLELLSLRGLTAGYNRDRHLLDEIQAQLRDWPNPADRPSAELASATMTALLHQERGDLREALKAMAPLAAQRSSTRAPRVLLRATSALARVQADKGLVDEALDTALEGVRLAESLGSSWRRALALNELARIYERAQQTERARQTSDEAMRAAKQDPDPVLMQAVVTVRGIVHANDADGAVTEQAWAAALQHAREAGSDALRATSLGNYSDHYLRRGDYERALELAGEALPLARRSQNLNGEIVALHNLGLAKIGLKRLEEGTRDVRQAITLDEQQGALPYAADGWKELGEYLEQAGDWAGAIQAHHEYRRLIDQILRDDTRKTVLEAQERHDAERRAKEIELLNRDNSLKSEQIRAHDLKLKLWAALAGCVLLSAALLGLAYQRIRRTNAALASSNETLKVQSERDPLTGLANRRHFQSAIKRLADAGKLAGTVYLIDIDHFKRINDQWGHAAGDSVLIEVARRLRAALREDDLVVRWGGEEFLIVVPARSSEDARTLAQRLLELIGTPPVPHGAAQQIGVTASIGFASFPLAPHGLSLSWERAIDLVDTAMYMAKAHGRNKAYGVLSANVRDEAGLAQLAKRLEAAWQEGLVELAALQGPAETQP